MRATIRTNRLSAEGTILDPRYDLMRTVAVIKGAHDDEVLIAALRTGDFIDDKVTGMTLVSPLGNR
jgi:hypothetical protein